MILSDIAVNILPGCRALASVACCKIVRGGRDGFPQGVTWIVHTLQRFIRCYTVFDASFYKTRPELLRDQTVYRYTRPRLLTRSEFLLVVLVPLGAFINRIHMDASFIQEASCFYVKGHDLCGFVSYGVLLLNSYLLYDCVRIMRPLYISVLIS